MPRQITQDEIDKLKEWNEISNKYVSIEAYQDMLNWWPDEYDANIELIKGEMEDACRDE